MSKKEGLLVLLDMREKNVVCYCLSFACLPCTFFFFSFSSAGSSFSFSSLFLSSLFLFLSFHPSPLSLFTSFFLLLLPVVVCGRTLLYIITRSHTLPFPFHALGSYVFILLHFHFSLIPLTYPPASNQPLPASSPSPTTIFNSLA